MHTKPAVAPLHPRTLRCPNLLDAQGGVVCESRCPEPAVATYDIAYINTSGAKTGLHVDPCIVVPVAPSTGYHHQQQQHPTDAVSLSPASIQPTTSSFYPFPIQRNKLLAAARSRELCTCTCFAVCATFPGQRSTTHIHILRNHFPVNSQQHILVQSLARGPAACARRRVTPAAVCLKHTALARPRSITAAQLSPPLCHSLPPQHFTTA